MGYRWVLHDASGSELRSTEWFASREEAENWMGAEWASLLEEGAEEVSLIGDDGRAFYRMGLREE